MSANKIMAILGMLVILGAGVTFAGENLQSRPFFIDENGDGICDFLRDSDLDGVPNCQDPDRIRAQDGTGNQNRFGNSTNYGFKNGACQGNGFSRNSFRNHSGQFGPGVCDVTSPKGNGYRGGKH